MYIYYISINNKYFIYVPIGYYVHLSTLAEVREQVLNYIQVLARPLVLNRTDHPVIFSQVYADVVVSTVIQIDFIDYLSNMLNIYRIQK